MRHAAPSFLIVPFSFSIAGERRKTFARRRPLGDLELVVEEAEALLYCYEKRTRPVFGTSMGPSLSPENKTGTKSVIRRSRRDPFGFKSPAGK